MAGPSGNTGAPGNLPYPTPDDDVDVPRDVQALATALNPQLGKLTPGMTMMWPGAAAPAGWAFCKAGVTVPAANNPQLAALLGQVGGVVTLPDMSDMFPIGTSAGAPLGQPGGSNTVAVGSVNLPPHSHRVDLNTDLRGNHGHNLAITNANVVDPAHVFAVAGGVTYANLQNITPGVIVPISTADTWHGEQGGHGHIGSTAVATGDHIHAVNGDSGNGPGASTALDNRPKFRAWNFIMLLG